MPWYGRSWRVVLWTGRQRGSDKGEVEDEVEVVTRTEAARNPYDSILFREASTANHRTPAPLPTPQPIPIRLDLAIATSRMALQPCSMMMGHVEAINSTNCVCFEWKFVDGLKS